MKFKSIKGKCVVNKKENTLIGEYHSLNFVGDTKTYYKLVGFKYNEMCSECTLDEDEKRERCDLYKKAFAMQG